MSSIWHDYSNSAELGIDARILADVVPVLPDPIVTGAFARDLHLWHRHGIVVQRQTTDIDLAIAMPDWNSFLAAREHLVASGKFAQVPHFAHRLRHENGKMVDLVPFGDVEAGNRTLEWPPDGSERMNVLGYREARAAAHRIRLPHGIEVMVVSYPSLVALKLLCWRDRHLRTPERDAQDAWMLLHNAFRCMDNERLQEALAAWSSAEDFQFETVGPRLLGNDIRRELGIAVVKDLVAMLDEQTRADEPGKLPNEMNGHDPDAALTLLKALSRGLADTATP